MAPQADDQSFDVAPVDEDERLGEAVEVYLELVERGEAPSADEFASRYGDLADDVRSALEGLELVHGLVGGSSSGGGGPGRNLESGRRIAGYRIVRELGRGGMGTVYEAVHVGLDRPVALKVLGTMAAPDSSARRRFLNEARTAAGLHHTHIVPVFDVGQVGGLCYYAMQRIEGSGLDRVVRWLRRERGNASGRSSEAVGRRGGSSSSKIGRAWSRASSHLPWPLHAPAPPRRALPAPSLEDPTPAWSGDRSLLSLSRNTGGLDPGLGRVDEDALPPFEPPRGQAYFRWAARVGMQAADALAHAHQHGVIHRDVKPSNLLIDADGSIWVADFGLARRLADPGLTQHDGMIGTPRYMSPEQGRTGVIDGRTDVYSLGATLYELITLRPPFDGATAAELLDQIAGREPVAPRSIDPRLPRDLETIVLKSLSKRPAERYASAAEQAADLGRFLNREPVKARRISLAGRAWRVMRRHPGISSVSAAAALIIMAVAGYAYHRVDRARQVAIHERDLKDAALDQVAAALQRTEEAVRESEAAYRTELWRRAELVRRTETPDRRTVGLDLLKASASKGPDPEMKARLRDEAVEFLLLRDIEPRIELATGATRDVLLGTTGARLTTLGVADGEEVAFWDVACRRRTDGVTLGRSLFREEGPMGRGGGPGGSGGRGGGRGWIFGERLVACGPNLAVAPLNSGTIQILDASTGALIRELPREIGRSITLVGEPTGKRLAAVEVGFEPMPLAGDRPSPGEFAWRTVGRVVLWDLEHPDAPPKVLAPQVELKWLERPLAALSADGKIAATTITGSTAIHLFSAEDGRATRTIDSPSEVKALALGDDMLAAASEGTIQLWNLSGVGKDAGGYVAGLSSSLSPVGRLQFNPQGNLLAVVSASDIYRNEVAIASRVEVWDTVTHRRVAILPAAEAVSDVAFSGDGRTLAASGQRVSTSIWRFRDSSVRTQVAGLTSRPLSIAVREDGLLAFTDIGGDVWTWREGSGAEPPERVATPETGPPRDLAARKDDPRPPMLDAGPGGRNRFGGRPSPPGAAFTAAGDLMIHDARGLELQPALVAADHKSTRVEIPSPQPMGRGGMGPMIVGGPLARSEDGRILAFSRGRNVYLWDADHPDKAIPVIVDEPHRRGGDRGFFFGVRPRTLLVSPNGDRLYILNEEPQSVQVWSLHRGEGRVAATIEHWVDGPPERPLMSSSAIALSPDGSLLAIVENGGAVILYDALQLAALGRIEPRADEPETLATTLAFSPDGFRLAVGSQQGAVRLWDLSNPESPELALRLPGEGGKTVALAFRPDGRRLAAACQDSLIEVWDLAALDDELRRLGLGE
ncbi:WD40 repeat domain-containing serine/threonine protein kinase [Paludisphaera rhizosphaerae]|uniref:WD40 repeat domain-containing serine/threonine protein kinase n=1 Tax=Paludisphaera rhizosphaerae TaxID=2711216 RepID=UPI0013EE1BD3|nr:WD40 repeat domain-containing serine/threonine protein kinase [Paludisphaera rhizosphaerae]